MIMNVCGTCNAIVDTFNETPEKRAVCQKCGSTKRSHDCAGDIKGEGARVFMSLKARMKDPGKPYIEIKNCLDINRDLDKVVEIHQIIDRRNNWYYKKVTDYENGSVIRYANKPLSDHTGYLITLGMERPK